MDKGNGNHVKSFEIKMDWSLVYFPSPKRWRFNPQNGLIEQGQMGGKGGKGKRQRISLLKAQLAQFETDLNCKF
jgi:hypothetical protein